MRSLRFLTIFLLLFMSVMTGYAAGKHADPAMYGVADTLLGKKELKTGASLMMDSLVRNHPMNANKNVQGAIVLPHSFTDNTTDFYLIAAVVLLLGFIRLANPRYFQLLTRSFFNPTVSSRQLREQVQVAHLANLLMNLFFALSMGAYLFYIIRLYFPSVNAAQLPSALLVGVLVAGVAMIYVVKYAMIRLTGWAFRVETLTDQYLYNVFLVNKVIAILLLPFIVLLAFGDPSWIGPVVVVSGMVVALLMLNRYLRSWQVFGSFFQYSRFHFFTYFCASELLPLAVLVKIMVRGMPW